MSVPTDFPQTIRSISAISKSPEAVITSVDHGFTEEDEGQTFIDFKQVQGMLQINGLPALVQRVLDSDNFTVNINTSQFYTYTGQGVFNIVSGTPPIQTTGFQTFNTPFQNIS